MSSVYFREGESAYLAGKDIEDCPYEPGTNEFWDWEDGWMQESEYYDDK